MYVLQMKSRKSMAIALSAVSIAAFHSPSSLDTQYLLILNQFIRRRRAAHAVNECKVPCTSP